MWSRKRLDVGWGDLAYGAWRCLRAPRAAPLEIRPATRPCDGAWLMCLSVRSAFDLLLTALDWPPGSEVLVSAVTIPDMAAIIAAHGLRAMPVDLTPDDMSPRLELLRQAITPATRGVLIAHLFGGRVELEPIAELAREHGLMLIEDCAQAYCGPGEMGHSRADVSMFSFGPIKTATALGGALIRVGDRQQLETMQARQTSYPMQSRRKFLLRIAKYAGLKFVSGPVPFGCLAHGCRWLGVDLDRLVNGSVRGFPRQDVLSQIRRRPCAALAALLDRRLRRFDRCRLESRAAAARLVIESLSDAIQFPGAAAADHSHWVLPVRTSQPQELIRRLREAGFDATQGQSLCVVPAPSDRAELDPCRARDTMTGIAFIPCYPELPRAALERLIETLAEFCRQGERRLLPASESQGERKRKRRCTTKPTSSELST